MNKLSRNSSKEVKEDTMKDIIVIEALDNGLWEIRILVQKAKDVYIERRKLCHV